MRRIKAFTLLAVTTLVATAACASKEDAEDSSQPRKRETQAIVEVVPERINVDKEAMRQQVHEQLRAVDQKLEALSARLEETGEQGRVALQQEMRELTETAKTLREKAKKAGTATGEVWGEIKRNVGVVAHKAQEAFTKAEESSQE